MFAKEKEIRYLFIIIAIYGLIGVVISLFVWPSMALALGIIFGVVISELNLAQLYRALKRAVDQHNAAAVSGSLFTRLILIIIGAVICWFLPSIFDIIGYLIGILIFPVAMWTGAPIIRLLDKDKDQGGGT